MPATQRGIYHNLRASKYAISNGEIAFYFSSQVYLKKFLERYQDHREQFDRKIDKVAADNLFNMDILADISLYKKIEKRGTHVQLMGVTITWRELHEYALRKMIKPNTLNWQKMQKPKSDEHLKTMV